MASDLFKASGFGSGLRRRAAVGIGVLIGCTGLSSRAMAGEAEAMTLLKSMTRYMAAQQAISFRYDTDLEIITNDKQRLNLASSGTVSLARPGSIRATRSNGFINTESVFDGKTFTLLGKGRNVYMQVPINGSIETLVDELKDKYRRPLPAADLLLPQAYEELTDGVIDVKDLGSGVIGGVECDHLAFRKKDVDFQIWIAQGDRPFPCRYQITSKLISGSPQYTVQVSDWQTGAAAVGQDFSFVPPDGARKITFDDLKKMKDMGELPSHYQL
ncbi:MULTISPECIES: DUF2092 domain-containing protein [Aphanothece]|uniref:DUF2092 domain-containing protein n=1 Tax=Aphanothece TaxID=1121 RepID=UPI0039847E8C